MSLAPLQRKRKVSEIGTGVHLVLISDMNLLTYPDGKVQKVSGFPAIVVSFQDSDNKVHDQMYIMDNDFRQASFMKMLSAAQVSTIKGPPKKAEAIGKRLYIAIKEVHYVNDDSEVIEEDGKEKIDYYIFRVYPYIEGGRKPRILGDPADNEGIPSQDFLAHKNISQDSYIEAVKEYEQQPTVNIPIPSPKEEPKEQEEEMPNFGDEEETVKQQSSDEHDSEVAQAIEEMKEADSDDEVPNF